jgi:hypothetical protein
MAGAIARIIAPASSVLHAPRGVAERCRQAVQYAVSPDAPGYSVVSWVDYWVTLSDESAPTDVSLPYPPTRVSYDEVGGKCPRLVAEHRALPILVPQCRDGL